MTRLSTLQAPEKQGDNSKALGSQKGRMAASLLFSTAAPRDPFGPGKHEEEMHHKGALLTSMNCIAELCPNLAELIRNGQEPFYSSDDVAAPRHKIGGSEA